MRPVSAAKSSGENSESTTATLSESLMSEESRRFVSDIDGDVILSPSIETVNNCVNSSFQYQFREGSLKASIFSLASSTLGAGIVSLPYAFQCLGLFVGCTALVGLAFVSCMATRLLTHSLLDKQKASYEELAHECGGNALLFFTQLVQILFNMGAAAGYIICVHDTLAVLLPVVRPSSSQSAASVLTVGLTLGVLLPLSSLSRVGSLRWTSLIGLTSMELLVIITLVVLIRRGVSTTMGGFPYWGEWYPNNLQSGFQGAGLAVFSLSCQSNAPLVLAEMERPALERMNKVAVRTALLSAGTYMVVGVCGFLLFGTGTAENVLLNYKKDVHSSFMIFLAFAGILVGVFFSFPMCIFPCRAAVEASLLPRDENQFNFVPGVLVCTALVCAFVVPSVASVFAFTGSLAGASIGFILPGYFALQTSSKTPSDRIQSFLCIGLGTFIAVVGTFLNFL